MATSGTQTYSQTGTEVILDALQLVGAYGIGFTVSAEDMTFCRSILNKMVKAWGAKGLHLFTKEEGVLYLQPGTSEYHISTTKATKASDEVITSLNGELAISATAVTVDSTSGMTVGDAIGVVLTDKTIHWTTIATIPSSTTLTLTVGVVSAAADGNLVYTYTTILPRILRVLDARRRVGIGESISDLQMGTIAYQEYMALPSKNTGSTPTQFAFKPTSTSGSFYVWGAPDDGAERIMFTYERVIEDLNNTDDDFDFPPEWLEPLTWQLAVRIGRPFGKPSVVQDLLPLASAMLQNLLEWDSEVAAVSFSPEIREY